MSDGVEAALISAWLLIIVIMLVEPGAIDEIWAEVRAMVLHPVRYARALMRRDTRSVR